MKPSSELSALARVEIFWAPLCLQAGCLAEWQHSVGTKVPWHPFCSLSKWSCFLLSQGTDHPCTANNPETCSTSLSPQDFINLFRFWTWLTAAHAILTGHFMPLSLDTPFVNSVNIHVCVKLLSQGTRGFQRWKVKLLADVQHLRNTEFHRTGV